MPRGKKTCPKCNTEHGPRTHKCECGYDFFAAKSAVKNEAVKNEGVAPVKSAGPITDRKQILSDVKSKISSIEDRNAYIPQTPSAFFIRPTENIAQMSRQLIPATANRNVYTPAGECPVKPSGYKNGQWEAPWNEDVIKEWADAVYASGPFLPEAVAYFAQFFWSVNGPEYKKVRNLVLEFLVAKTKVYVDDEVEVEELEEITN